MQDFLEHSYRVGKRICDTAWWLYFTNDQRILCEQLLKQKEVWFRFIKGDLDPQSLPLQLNGRNGLMIFFFFSPLISA